MARPDYELTEAADNDLLSIARYTIQKWGITQARRYDASLEKHFHAIGQGKIQPRLFSKRRPELLFTHCEHHYIFYRLRDQNCPLIIAVLHENMNLTAYIKKRLQ